MKILNCACPKCGKQTTEYSEDKWTCLHCGNKFVIKEEAASVVNNISSFNVSSNALFDLDVQNKKEFKTEDKERIVGYKNELSDEYKQVLSKQKRGLKPYFFATLVFMGSVVVVLGNAAEMNPSEIKGAICGGCLPIAIAVGIIGLLISRDSKRKEIAKIQQYKEVPIMGISTIINSYCPYCSNVFHQYEQTSQLQQDFNLGLTHCLKCGKQFIIQEGVSYRIANNDPQSNISKPELPLPIPIIVPETKIIEKIIETTNESITVNHKSKVIPKTEEDTNCFFIICACGETLRIPKDMLKEIQGHEFCCPKCDRVIKEDVIRDLDKQI